jgi:hypothetical protein
MCCLILVTWVILVISMPMGSMALMGRLQMGRKHDQLHILLQKGNMPSCSVCPLGSGGRRSLRHHRERLSLSCKLKLKLNLVLVMSLLMELGLELDLELDLQIRSTSPRAIRIRI